MCSSSTPRQGKSRLGAALTSRCAIKNIFHDVGTDEDDDLPHHLKLAELTVAVETVPSLPAIISQYFQRK